MKYINIDGNKYNLLTVLNKDPNNGYNVIVQCDCGNQISVSKFQLMNRMIGSCKNRKCRSLERHIPSEIGRKFGNLTIVSENFTINNRGYYLVEVQCICELKFEIQHDKLSNQIIDSCYYHRKTNGMPYSISCQNRVEDLTGKKFKDLTVKTILLDENGKQPTKKIQWVCDCVCGKTINVKSGNLPTTGSCGCTRELRISEGKALNPYTTAVNIVYSDYLWSAKNRNYSFELSINIFSKIIEQNCHYCGSAPSREVFVNTIAFGNNKFLFNGIDRKNNEIGYTVENCLSCCTRCNYAKKSSSYEEYVKFLDQIVAFRCGS